MLPCQHGQPCLVNQYEPPSGICQGRLESAGRFFAQGLPTRPPPASRPLPQRVAGPGVDSQARVSRANGPARCPQAGRVRPKLSELLRRRREGQPARVLAVAHRARERLAARYRRTALPGTPVQPASISVTGRRSARPSPSSPAPTKNRRPHRRAAASRRTNALT